MLAKTETITIRVTAEIKDRLRQLAEEDERTVSQYVERIIREKIKGSN